MNKRIFFFAFGAVWFSVLVGIPVFAQANDYLFLDNATVAKGYTIAYEQKQMRIAIPPHALSGETTVALSQIASRDSAASIAPPPDGAVFASSLFSYSFGNGIFFQTPISISLAMYHQSSLVRLYAFDPRTKKWSRLSSQIIAPSSVNAKSEEPSAYVAVLAFPSDQEELAYLLSLPKAVMVADTHNHVFVAQNTHASLPLASLTKLMTALVFLDRNRGWNTLVRIDSSMDTPPAKIYFHNGDTITAHDLFYGMLVGSKNNAARALVRSTGLNEKQFVAFMNEKASALGLGDTHFADVTGLSKENKSSVRDYSTVMSVALASSVIRTAVQTSKYLIHVRNRSAFFLVTTTDEVLNDSKTVYGKTGYIPEAGYNLILTQERPKQKISILIFGAPTDQDRFDLARALLARKWY